jgi:hypothetical protein
VPPPKCEHTLLGHTCTRAHEAKATRHPIEASHYLDLELLSTPSITHNTMPPFRTGTVDRLDKPSSYTASKVRNLSLTLHPKPTMSKPKTIQLTTSPNEQNRKRKRNQDRERRRESGTNGPADEEEREREVRIHRSPSPDDKLKDATTLYVGNLSFYTTEEQIHELFSKCVLHVLLITAYRVCTYKFLIDAVRSSAW